MDVKPNLIKELVAGGEDSVEQDEGYISGGDEGYIEQDHGTIKKKGPHVA